MDCIHFEEGFDRKLYIDPDQCIDSGACEPVCPVTAIFTEDDVPDDMKEYIELDAQWYRSGAGAGPHQRAEAGLDIYRPGVHRGAAGR